MVLKLKMPFKQAKAYGPKRKVTQMVVIHATDNERADDKATANDEAAENEAGYATHRPDGISAHLYVDDDSAVQAVDLDRITYGCFPTGNARSVQLELAGVSNRLSIGTITRAARLTAPICHHYDLPIRKLSATDLRAGRKGICGHADVTKAWNTGPDSGAGHTDPGADFPWASFIKAVKVEYARLYGPKAPAKVPAAAPAAKPPTHTVRRGDTLGAIAKAHGTTVAKLVKLNKIKDPDHIEANDVLRLR